MLSSSVWTPEVFWGNLNDRYYNNGSNNSERSESECCHFESSSSLFESIEAWNASGDGDQSSDGEETFQTTSWIPNDVSGSSFLEALQVNDLGFSLLEDDDWNNDGDVTEPSVPSSPAPQEQVKNTRFHSLTNESATRKSHLCSSSKAANQNASTSSQKRCPPDSATSSSKAPSRKKLQLKRVKRIDKETIRKPPNPPPPPPSLPPSRKVHQQSLKERRSGLFHREQVLSIQHSISEEEIDILG